MITKEDLDNLANIAARKNAEMQEIINTSSSLYEMQALTIKGAIFKALEEVFKDFEKQ